MKTIAIDCRFASTNSGIGRYTRELVSELIKSNECNWKLLVKSVSETWPNGTELIHAPFDHYSLSEQIRLPKLLKESEADLLFSPHFNVPFFCPIPYVITIHDLILHRYPNQSSALKRFAYKLLMSRAVRKSKHIITISNFVLNDIAQTYGRNKIKNKTSVIYEGVSDNFYPRSKVEQNDEFFLYVGNAKEHKNVQTLIDAHKQLPDDSPSLVLVCGGTESKKLKINNRVRLISEISDEELPALYSSAKAFVTASLYEGYCLPVTEAQACGCPVIASNKGAIPEVAGNEAKLIEPNIEQLVEAMRNPPAPPKNFNKPEWKSTSKGTMEVLIKCIT
ncbi:MAG: glycosyltransferase family 1 protein [Candidatus Peribacteraceae bacterium]|nr:glycosyltransferase family 1 protein [Candidatus Peribacteraceae bacterium]